MSVSVVAANATYADAAAVVVVGVAVFLLPKMQILNKILINHISILFSHQLSAKTTSIGSLLELRIDTIAFGRFH